MNKKYIVTDGETTLNGSWTKKDAVAYLNAAVIDGARASACGFYVARLTNDGYIKI